MIEGVIAILKMLEQLTQICLDRMPPRQSVKGGSHEISVYNQWNQSAQLVRSTVVFFHHIQSIVTGTLYYFWCLTKFCLNNIQLPVFLLFFLRIHD
jgi:hypothetical protein